VAELIYTRFNESPGSTHQRLLDLVGDASRVLDIGCATGYLAEQLQARGSEVVGIELDPRAAELAEQHCSRVIVMDVDEGGLTTALDDERFDVILLGDVLEHLRRPDLVLTQAASLLVEGGAIVASVPNIAHGSVRLALLAGIFEYRDSGLLDRTHLRFFTERSFRELLASSGLVVTREAHQRIPISGTEIPIPPAAPADAVAALEHDDTAMIYQFIVRAVPIREGSALELEALRGALDALRAELGERDHDVATARELAEEVERARGALALDVELLRGELEDANARLRVAEEDLAELDVLHRHVQHLQGESARADALAAQMAALEQTRVLRMASRWWSIKKRVLGKS
jgi:O-antigen biosynthesis protein